MGFLKKLGTWLVMGLFVGAGFTVAMYAVGYFAMGFYMDSARERMEERLGESGDTDSSAITSFTAKFKEYSPASGLVVTSHKERKRGNDLDILGVLENQGTDSWSAVTIEVELFDKDGNYVDECNEYLRGTIQPGGKQNFKVSCRRCDNSPVPDHERYTIEIKDAHFKQG